MFNGKSYKKKSHSAFSKLYIQYREQFPKKKRCIWNCPCTTHFIIIIRNVIFVSVKVLKAWFIMWCNGGHYLGCGYELPPTHSCYYQQHTVSFNWKCRKGSIIDAIQFVIATQTAIVSFCIATDDHWQHRPKCIQWLYKSYTVNYFRSRSLCVCVCEAIGAAEWSDQC